MRTDTALLKVEEKGTMAVAYLKPTNAPNNGGEASVEELNFGCMVWSAGLTQVKFVEGIECWQKGPSGRLIVDDFQRIPGTKGRVMAIGDCCANESGALVPLAQVAEQQGKYLANVFNGSYASFSNPSARLEEDLPEPAPVRPYSWPVPEFLFDAKSTFRFINKGSMSSAGMGGGITEDPLGLPVKISGLAAFAAWRGYYLSRQFSLSNMILVPMFWLKSMVFGRDISRF